MSSKASDTVQESIEVASIIGDSGRYQVIVLLVTCFSTATVGSISVIMELLAPSVTMYWDWEASSPNKTVFQSTHCRKQDIWNYNLTSKYSNSTSRLIYETPYSNRPLTVEMNLVCERSWLVSFANTAQLIGQLAGYIIIPVSEKFGRRKVTLVFTTGLTLASLCLTFSQGIIMFLVIFFFAGLFIVLPCNLLFTQVVEIFPSSRVSYVGAVNKIGLLLGQTVIVGLAWLLKDWFYLQVYHTVYLAISAILSWYVLDSPTWLAVRGRYDDARNNLVKILHRNGRDSQTQADKIDQWLAHMRTRCEIQSRAEKGSFKDLFKNKEIGSYTAIFTFSVSSAFFIYYGIVLNIESFGSGLFLDFTLGNAFSLVSMVACGFALVKVSTRNLIIFGFICETIICVVYTATYDILACRTVLSVLARVFISPVVSIMFVYSSELFPTSVRAAIIGFASLISRPFNAASSFTKDLGENTAMYVPFILFSVLSFINALAILFLPDTRKRPLIHTVDELLARKKEDEEPKVYTIPSTRL